MEIWSSGEETIVYDDAGLTFFRGDELQEILSVGGEPVTLGARKGLYSTTRKIFAVNPETRTALLGECGEIPSLVDLGQSAQPTKLGFRWAAALHLTGRRYLAVLPEDEKLHFRFVELDSRGNVVDESPLEVPDVRNVEIPPLTASRVEGTLPEASGVEAKGPFFFNRSRHGITVSDAGTGIVLLIRLSPDRCVAAVRVPISSGEETVLASPLQDGFCVSVTIREGHSGLACFDESGAQRWALNTVQRALVSGGGAPFAASDTTIAWPHSTQAAALLVIDSASGSVVSEEKLPGSSAFYDSIFCVGDGEVYLGARSAVTRLRRASDGAWSAAVLDRKSIPKRIRDQHAPVSGVPMIQLKPLSESWVVPAGGTLALGFELSNAGGPGSGVELELSGDALEKGLIEGIRAKVGASETRFERPSEKLFRVKLPDFPVPPATETGTKRTKVQPALVKPLEIEVSAKSAGSGFLMVRVKTSGNVTSATGKALQVR